MLKCLISTAPWWGFEKKLWHWTFTQQIVITQVFYIRDMIYGWWLHIEEDTVMHKWFLHPLEVKDILALNFTKQGLVSLCSTCCSWHMDYDYIYIELRGNCHVWKVFSVWPLKVTHWPIKAPWNDIFHSLFLLFYYQ